MYTKWDNFYKVIEKAKTACETSGSLVADYFAGTGKMIEPAKGAQREIEDIALTRYACYLIAQNGDTTKPSIAFANELTSHNVVKKNLHGEQPIAKEHIDNNLAVRKILKELAFIKNYFYSGNG